MGLQEYRRQLDEIDGQIVRLFEERMNISEKVAEDKIRSGKRVLDKKREQEKIETLTAMTGNDFDRRGVREIFEQLMAISRKRQYQLMGEAGELHGLPFIPVDSLVDEKTRVVYQGAPGAYSEAAMKEFFGKYRQSNAAQKAAEAGKVSGTSWNNTEAAESASGTNQSNTEPAGGASGTVQKDGKQGNETTQAGVIDNFHVDTFRDAMSAIEEGAADYAVLPIENSTAGIVSQNYDLLFEFENYIVGEQIIPIRHCLMGVPGTTLSSIRTVYSHAQSLMQSQRFLDQHPEWQQVGMQNNAYAAQKVARDKDTSKACIASKYAAEAYGLEILEEGVNDSYNNSTRFVIVTNRKVFLRDAKKISIVIEVEHESGALYRALSHFIYNDLNMTKIESRPIPDRSFEYRFFIDFDGNLQDSAVRNALRGLRDETKHLKVLGNY